MAWAIVGAAAIGGVINYAASENAKSAQKQATKAMEKSSDAQAAIAQEQLAFSKEQYDDWQRVYGPIQDRLSSFYQNLDPQSFAAQSVKQLQQQYSQVSEQMERSWAQRGIDSPAQEAMQQQAALGMARGAAEIRANAPLQLATAQQGFLNQQVSNPATASIANASANLGNVFGNQAAMAQGQANAYGQQYGQAMQGVGQAITGGVAGYFQNQAYQNQMNQLQTASTYGTKPWSTQTQMLAKQDAGF